MGMSKKDTEVLIQKIKDFLERQPNEENQRGEPRLNALLELFKTLNQIETDTTAEASIVREYTSVKAIAILQSGVRIYVKDIVNHLAESDRPLPKVEETITLEMVREFKDKHYTLGDFVAHLWAYSSVEQIAAAMERVTGKKLLEIFELHARAIKAKPEDDKSFYDKTLAALARLFKRRNIICHEIGPEIVCDHSELLEELYAVFGLLVAVGNYAYIEMTKSKKA